MDRGVGVWCVELRVWYLGFGVWGFGFRVWDLECHVLEESPLVFNVVSKHLMNIGLRVRVWGLRIGG